jgi:sugar phosphate isomerase/epimerase
MRLGFCTSYEKADAFHATGWDFIEECVQTFLQGQLPDERWKGMDKLQISALPIPSANMLVPGELKITGSAVDLEKLRMYMSRVIERAGKTGARTLVFGSGGARNVTDNFSREAAKRQITEFLQMCVPMLSQHSVAMVVEPLNRVECNIINSVAEAVEYVKAIDHPNVKALVDSYHFWLENEPLENLKTAMPWIAHVHVADKDGRTAPGLSGKSDYKPFFRALKQGNYRGDISVECMNFTDYKSGGASVLEYLKHQWKDA